MIQSKEIIMTSKIKHMFYQRYYPLDDINKCWLWRGSMTNKGYGQLTVRENKAIRCYRAHKLSYMIHYNLSQLEPVLVLHKCPGGGNPACVNPYHLVIGTQAENIEDKLDNNRQARGSKINTNILTEEEVIQIRLEYSKGYLTFQQLGDKYGVTRQAIYLIVKRINWSYLP